MTRSPGTPLALLLAGAAAALLLGAPGAAAALDEAGRLWLVGERAFEDRLNSVARVSLERLIERYPTDKRAGQAALLLGKVRFADGHFEPALAAFRQAKSFDPPPGEPDEARFWEAETLFRMGRFDAARGAYDALVAANAASRYAPDSLYGLAWSELELKHREAAINAFRQLISAYPEHATVGPATYYLARSLVDAKRYDEAVGLLRGYGERYPKSRLIPDALYLQGLARISAGERNEGIGDLRQFIASYPQHELANQARRTIVDRLLKDGRKDELAEEYRTLMAQTPPTAESVYDAGFIATRLGRPRDADAAWAVLRKEFPGHPLAARASLEMAQGAFGRNAFKDAATLARGAAKSDDGAVRAQAQLLVGESELKLNRPAPALQAFKEAAETAGSEDPAVRYRALAGAGLALEDQGKLSEAMRQYDQVANECPDRELRAWAKTRKSAVAAQLKPAPSAPSSPKPAAKPRAQETPKR
jgi:TolA-binding protein